MLAQRQQAWRLLLLMAAAAVVLLVILNSLLPTDEVVYWVSTRPSGPPPGCACSGTSGDPPAVPASVRSNCGPAADRHGPGQNVITFSFFGSTNSTYFSGLAQNAEAARRLYPGWRVRVYTDVTPEWSAHACQLSCSERNVDFCDVRSLPDLGDLTPWFGMIWRFMALGDPSVDRFIVRDSDSLLTERERDAVDAWIASNLTFHVMRDHPQHRLGIMGGMWGGWNRRPDPYGTALRRKIIDATRSHRKQEDQKVLQTVVWPLMEAEKDVLQHDSYWCAEFLGSRPFPTQRLSSGKFVGAPSLRLHGQVVSEQCPVECRPLHHTDWLYC